MKAFFLKIWDKLRAAWAWLMVGWRIYYIVIALFVIWVGFFDRDSLRTQFKLKSKINAADREIVTYKEQIKSYNEQIERLKSSDEVLEQYAREKYFMKSSNEDVYIVDEE